MACRCRTFPQMDYPAEFISGLNKPLRIWTFLFRTHIRPSAGTCSTACSSSFGFRSFLSTNWRVVFKWAPSAHIETNTNAS